MTTSNAGVMQTYLEFTVEAAHKVPGFSHLHGHTFVVHLTFEGEQDPKYGWVADLYSVKKITDEVKRQIGAGDESGDGLGEGNLMDIPELEIASLENFAMWIWGKIAPSHPNLKIVDVNRGFRGSIEGCRYQGPKGQAVRVPLAA